jgi:hypothetical protein
VNVKGWLTMWGWLQYQTYRLVLSLALPFERSDGFQ